MTKQELIEKYKKTIENNNPYTELDISNNLNRAFNFKKHFKFVARAKVARAKAQIELLKEIIADLEKMD